MVVMVDTDGIRQTMDDTRGLAYARKRAFKEESEKY